VIDGPAAHLLEIAEIERVAALGWRGLEEERLGDWLLRAGNGFTGRANSALPLGDPDYGLDAAIDAVANWYRVRQLNPLVQVPLELREDVDEALDRRGWQAFNRTYVLVGHLDELLERAAPIADLPAATLDTRPTHAWLGGYRYRGSTLPVGAEDVLSRAVDPVFASVQVGGRVVAVGRGVVDEGWLGVTAVTVDDAHRRRGLASHVMRATAVWAAARGAERVYLQVAAENTAALAMYDRLGLERHHEYRYRRLDLSVT